MGFSRWLLADLQVHTPADKNHHYGDVGGPEPNKKFARALLQAHLDAGVQIVAVTDHNSVGGYAAMHREVETLTLLERLGRMTDVERETLSEYRRLLAKVTVLPGFEFTATFGQIEPPGTFLRWEADPWPHVPVYQPPQDTG